MDGETARGGGAAPRGRVGGLPVPGDGKAGASFRLQPEEGLFWVNGRPYRGSVEVWNTPGGLQIINQIAVEDYVRGVMKVEANPDWPVEALKAQAVVARTYALHERLSDPGRPLPLSGHPATPRS